jgi:hypothetical protein
MGQSRTYQLVDVLIGGDLDHRLRLWKSCQVSVPAMARLLEADTGVDLSPETVRRWVRALNGRAA